MKKLLALLERSKRSSFRRRLLNLALSRAIPFNMAHGIRIEAVKDSGVRSVLPYKRKNLNHLKGIHACGLATIVEFTAGMSLLTVLRSDAFRFILKDLQMTYHFQAKETVYAELSLSPDWISSTILEPLKAQDAVFIEIPVDVYDTSGNHICTGKAHWQIKKWDKVRTK